MRQKAEKVSESATAEAEGSTAATDAPTAAAAAAAGTGTASVTVSQHSREQIASIRTLEQEVSGSKEKVNNLVALLRFLAGEEDARVAKAAMHALRRLFTGNCASLSAVAAKLSRPDSGKDESEAAKDVDASTAKAQEIYDAWVCKQYQEFKRMLLLNLHHQDTTVQVLALVIILQLVKAESGGGGFAVELLGRLVRALYTVDDDTPPAAGPGN
eukprot:SAG31_NODE_12766_length_918_cov_1.426129_1_plen_214_part_00